MIWDRFLYGVGGDKFSDTESRINTAPLDHEQFRKLQSLFILTGSNDAKVEDPSSIVTGITRCALAV